MAFVKMSNLLGKSIEVPRGAVGAYQSLGFVVEGETSVAEPAVETTNENDINVDGVEMSDDEQFVHELEKKPLAQWNKDEVKKYATICGVDISGTKNAQEAKERIKAFIDEKTE